MVDKIDMNFYIVIYGSVMGMMKWGVVGVVIVVVLVIWLIVY